VPDAGEVVLDQLIAEGRSGRVMVLRRLSRGVSVQRGREASRRIHSRYCRRLNDLPWEGISVRIELRVRRFFCETEGCGHHIFTERLPKTVQRYARRTCRLSEALERITLVLGGSAGSRLAEQLGILASGQTLLRQLRRKVIFSSAQAPRVLGIDDWAWRKGRRYGTIFCDLERGKIVDLLPVRSAESTAQWLRAHPGTEIVSRDRASLHAEAATKAAPHAVQVADRWHLLHNMSEALVAALCHIIVCWQRWRRPQPEDRKRQPHLLRNNRPLPSHHLANNVFESRTDSAAWLAMKRSWNKSGRAPRRGRSHATAASAGKPFAVGSVPTAFRNEGRAVIRLRSISIKVSGTALATSLLECRPTLARIVSTRVRRPIPHRTWRPFSLHFNIPGATARSKGTSTN
jgi:transposase